MVHAKFHTAINPRYQTTSVIPVTDDEVTRQRLYVNVIFMVEGGVRVGRCTL